MSNLETKSTIQTIKTSCCYGGLILFFGTSLMLLPYELFFVSAVVILFLLQYLEKNMHESAPNIHHTQKAVVNNKRAKTIFHQQKEQVEVNSIKWHWRIGVEQNTQVDFPFPMVGWCCFCSMLSKRQYTTGNVLNFYCTAFKVNAKNKMDKFVLIKYFYSLHLIKCISTFVQNIVIESRDFDLCYDDGI